MWGERESACVCVHICFLLRGLRADVSFSRSIRGHAQQLMQRMFTASSSKSRHRRPPSGTAARPLRGVCVCVSTFFFGPASAEGVMWADLSSSGFMPPPAVNTWISVADVHQRWYLVPWWDFSPPPIQPLLPLGPSWDVGRKPNLTAALHMTAQQTRPFRNQSVLSNTRVTVRERWEWESFFFSFKEMREEKKNRERSVRLSNFQVAEQEFSSSIGFIAAQCSRDWCHQCTNDS